MAIWRGEQIDIAITRFTPVVKAIARTLAAKLPSSIELQDLVQSGMIGLLEAATRFDDAKGVEFSVYAKARISGQMLDDLRADDWVPRGVRRERRRVDEALKTMQQRHGGEPKESQVAAEMGITLEALQKMRSANARIEVDIADADQVDESADPSQPLFEKQFRRALVRSIESLSPQQRLVMSCMFEHDLNQREVAQVLEITESRVSQIRRQTVLRMRGVLQELDVLVDV